MRPPDAHQVAALCWRKTSAETEVLLVTSRETKRWIIPKGWPMPGKPDHTAAKIESEEEAGVEGRVMHQPIGSYDYRKREIDGSINIRVDVYSLKVERLRKSWPEMAQRKRIWFTTYEASLRVVEPELKALLLAFDL